MIVHIILLIVISVIISTLIYYYLHKKTRISLKYLYIDNIFVILVTVIIAYLVGQLLNNNWMWVSYFSIIPLALGIAFSFTMIRFWRTPKRKVTASQNEIISPADGNVIYINKIEEGEVPISNKKGVKATLDEIVQTDLIEVPCWIIGINMTPFDVHKNCAPIDGKIILNKHIKGEFRSLKDLNAIAKNERQTIVIQNDELKLGIVQTASKMVRRIDSYINEGDMISRGSWYGMIRFGSQVDIILPQRYKPSVEIGQQVYAAKSIIACK